MPKFAITYATILSVALFLGAAAVFAQSSAQTAPHATPPPGAQSGATAAPQAQAPATPSPFKDQKEKLSYALGMSLGENFRRQSMEVDTDTLVRGINDGLSGGKTLMTDQELQATLMQMQSELRAKQQERIRAEATANKKQGEDFLEANKNKPGVVTLPSGLQYKVITQGTGPTPLATDTVVCNYRGTLIDGSEFDSSAKNGGKPASFQVGRVIRGWTEALQLMPAGSKWELYIPANLAYGERGAGPIGPNATLIFEVELLSIEKPELGKPATPPPTKP